MVFLLSGLNRVVLSDLHEETRQQGSLNVEGVVSGTEGGHRDGQLDPLQSVRELGAKSVGHEQSGVIQVEILTPLLHITVCQGDRTKERIIGGQIMKNIYIDMQICPINLGGAL